MPLIVIPSASPVESKSFSLCSFLIGNWPPCLHSSTSYKQKHWFPCPHTRNRGITGLSLQKHNPYQMERSSKPAWCPKPSLCASPHMPCAPPNKCSSVAPSALLCLHWGVSSKSICSVACTHSSRVAPPCKKTQELVLNQ